MNLPILRHTFRAFAILAIIFISGCTEESYVTPETYGSLSGRVLSQDTKQPLSGAVVRISPSSKAVTTDQSGYFKADSIPSGNYTLLTSLEKYRNDLTTATVQENRNADLTIYLSPDAGQNKAPSPAEVVKPAHQSTGNERKMVLAWKSSDPDKDTLKYDVFIFREGETEGARIASSISADSVSVNDLSFNTTYYWQVIASDGHNAPVKSEIWTFRTRPLPDIPYYFSRKAGESYQVFASDGSGEVQLTNGANNWKPVVSPLRNRLAFLSNRERETYLYVADIDGKNATRVTGIPVVTITPATELSFCWSPDGTRLVFPSYDKLYSVHTDGTGLSLISRAPVGKFFASADWTAQGDKIVTRLTTTSVYENEIVLIDLSLGTSLPVVSNLEGKTGNPVFSVDGRKILYTFDVENFRNMEGRQLNARMFLHDLRSGDKEDISPDKPPGTNDLDPRFAPNGATIIFTNTSNDDFSSRNIYTIDLLNRKRALLISDAQMPYWR